MSSGTALNAVLTLLTLALDATVVLLLAWVTTLVIKRKSGVQHAIWVAAFATLILLPPLTLVHPAHKTVPIEIPLATQVSIPTQVDEAAPALTKVESPETDLNFIERRSLPKHVESAPNWPMAARYVLGFWVTGSGILLFWIAFAVQGLWSLRRSSVPIQWRDGELKRLALQINLRRKVQLRISKRDFPVSAVTWGTWRPIVLLPRDASGWPDDQRESILLHELAHVKRCDSFYQLLAALASAIFWFHPAVWFASSSMRAEAETAADDAVIRSGVRPTDYASSLVALAARFGPKRQPRISLGVFMMKRLGIESRVRSIIDPNRRRRGATFTQVAGIVTVAVLVMFVLANLRPILATGPDQREALFEEALFTATKHERNQALRDINKLSKKHHEFSNVTASLVADKHPSNSPKEKKCWCMSSRSARVALAKKSTGTISAQPSFSVQTLKGKGDSIVSMQLDREAAVISEAKKQVQTPLVAKIPTDIKIPKFKIPAAVGMPIVKAQPLTISVPMVQQQIASLPISQKADVQASNTRILAPFHSVTVGPVVQLILRAGIKQGYSVSCGSDKQSQVVANVENGVLHVGSGEPISVVVTTPKLNRLEVFGNSTVNCTGIEDSHFKLIESGASSVHLDGHAINFSIDLSGSSSLIADNLTAKRLRADMSGASSGVLDGQFGHLALNLNENSSACARGRVVLLDLSGNGGATADCSSLVAQIVQADACDGTKMQVNAVRSLTASAKGAAGIIYKGDPTILNITPDASSRISL